MKLFKVEIEGEIWVLAENHGDAMNRARRAIRDEIDNMLVMAEEVTSSTTMDAGWAAAIPYGSKTDETVAEWRQKFNVAYEVPEELKKAVASVKLHPDTLAELLSDDKDEK